MRRSFVLAIASLSLLLPATFAQAGWSGCRIGVQGGVNNGTAYLTSNPGSTMPLIKPDATTAMGGIEGGCDIGLPFIVVGVGASYDFMNATQSSTSREVTGIGALQTVRTATVDSRSRGIAAFTGRAGFDLGPFLLFGRAGLALAPQTSRYTYSIAAPLVGTTSTDVSVSHWRTGYVLGLGAEMQLGAVVVKLEYDHFNFGTRDALMQGIYDRSGLPRLPVSMKLGNSFSVNALRAGVAYKF